MMDLKKQFLKIFSITILVTVAFLSQADAAIRVEAEFSASEEGLSLSYDIPIVGRGNLKLENPGDSDSIAVRILFIKFLEVELSINEITTDPNVINLHYVASTIFVPVGDLEGDIPIPFGSAGAVINIMGRIFVPTGDHNIDISFLFTKSSTQYDIQVDLAELIQESFEGEASPADNQINEQITNPLDGSVLADIDLVLDYSSRFFTILQGSVNVCTPSLGGNQADGDCRPILPLPSIPVPNGSYHIWLDLDESFLDQLFPDIPGM